MNPYLIVVAIQDHMSLCRRRAEETAVGIGTQGLPIWQESGFETVEAYLDARDDEWKLCKQFLAAGG